MLLLSLRDAGAVMESATTNTRAANSIIIIIHDNSNKMNTAANRELRDMCSMSYDIYLIHKRAPPRAHMK